MRAYNADTHSADCASAKLDECQGDVGAHGAVDRYDAMKLAVEWEAGEGPRDRSSR